MDDPQLLGKTRRVPPEWFSDVFVCAGGVAGGELTIYSRKFTNPGIAQKMGLERIEIIMELQDALGIELPDETADLPTVGELAEYVSKRFDSNEPEAVWQIVRKIAAEELQVPIDSIQPGSRWIEDLDC